MIKGFIDLNIIFIKLKLKISQISKLKNVNRDIYMYDKTTFKKIPE